MLYHKSPFFLKSKNICHLNRLYLMGERGLGKIAVHFYSL